MSADHFAIGGHSIFDQLSCVSNVLCIISHIFCCVLDYPLLWSCRTPSLSLTFMIPSMNATSVVTIVNDQPLTMYIIIFHARFCCLCMLISILSHLSIRVMVGGPKAHHRSSVRQSVVRCG